VEKYPEKGVSVEEQPWLGGAAAAGTDPAHSTAGRDLPAAGELGQRRAKYIPSCGNLTMRVSPGPGSSLARGCVVFK